MEGLQEYSLPALRSYYDDHTVDLEV